MDDTQDLSQPSAQNTPQLQYFRPQIPSTNPLLRIIGAAMGKTAMSYGNPMLATNAQPDTDTGDSLGIPRPAVAGKDPSGRPLYDYQDIQRYNQDIATTRKMKMLTQMRGNISNPAPSQDMAALLNKGDTEGAIAQWQQENPQNPDAAMPLPWVKQLNAAKGTMSRADMSGAFATRAQAQMMNTIYKMGGGDAIQKAAAQANTNLLAAKKAQALVDQIDASGGQANIRQRTELASSLGQLAGSGQGQLTDEKMNQFIPQTLQGKVAGWKEWWTNDNQPMDFSGFLPQMKDMLSRETQANQDFSNNAAQFGKTVANAIRPGSGQMIDTARASSPIFNPSAPNATPRQKPVDTTGRVLMIKPDKSVVAVAAKDVIRARARGYTVK